MNLPSSPDPSSENLPEETDKETQLSEKEIDPNLAKSILSKYNVKFSYLCKIFEGKKAGDYRIRIDNTDVGKTISIDKLEGTECVGTLAFHAAKGTGVLSMLKGGPGERYRNISKLRYNEKSNKASGKNVMLMLEKMDEFIKILEDIDDVRKFSKGIDI